MGVTKLWKLLEEETVGDLVPLQKCSGQSWAVDLSTWIVHGRTGAQGKPGVDPKIALIRTVFSRACCLLKHGIRPVFVMDGQNAPEVKSQALNERSERMYGHTKMTGSNRVGLLESNTMCQKMLKALGLSVITSCGEAEKTCALLNSQGIVDACLSDDSDAFLYGAKTVYRNLDFKKKCASKYCLSSIEDKMKLTQKDLVVMALLSGCDYGNGLEGVGPKKVLNLIKSIKEHSHEDDVLERVCNWKENRELDTLQQEKDRLTSMKKATVTHCEKCHHPGNVNKHSKNGCSMCASSEACVVDSNIPCTCVFHKVEQKIMPFATELDLRFKAKQDPSFPNTQLVREFMDSTKTFLFSDVTVTLPQLNDLAKELTMRCDELMKKMIPVLLLMELYGTLSLPSAGPLKVVRESKQDGVPCYLVLWQKFDFDKWTPQPSDNAEKTPQAKKLGSENPYNVNLPRDLFNRKYPTLVKKFTSSTTKVEKFPSSTTKKGKGKRPVEADSSQQKLTSFFEVANPAKKRLVFQEDGQA